MTPKNAHLVAEAILDQQYQEVESVIEYIEVPQGNALLVRGDLSGNAEIRGASAVVIEGNILGSRGQVCQISTEGPVVILGQVRYALIEGQAIYFNRGASASRLIANDEVHVKEDLVDAKVHIGNVETLHQEIGVLRDIIRSGRDQKQSLQQQLLFKRQQLAKLFATTGINFNLNIGQIVRSRKEGIYVTLTSFYNALEGRTEDEIDRALRELFAKAILGVLTRLNQSYIGQGPASQKAFASVVQKLQDLVFHTREVDKVVDQIQKREDRFWSSLGRFNKNDGALCVQGRVVPQLELCFSRLDRVDQGDVEAQVVLHKFEMDLRFGVRDGRHEAVVKYNGQPVDMVFVLPEALQQVNFYAPKDRIMWASKANDRTK